MKTVNRSKNHFHHHNTVCKFFDWSVADFINGHVGSSSRLFCSFSLSNSSQYQLQTAHFLSEVISIRDGSHVMSNNVFHLYGDQ